MGRQCERCEWHIKQGVFGQKSKRWHSQTDREDARPYQNWMPKRPRPLWRYLPTPRLSDLTAIHCQSRRLVSSFSLVSPICAPSRLGGILSHASSTPSMRSPLVRSDLDVIPGRAVEVYAFLAPCRFLPLASIKLLVLIISSTRHHCGLSSSYAVPRLHP